MKTRYTALQIALEDVYKRQAHEFADAGNGETLFDVLLHNTSKLGAELDVFWAAYAGDVYKRQPIRCVCEAHVLANTNR